MAKKKAVKNKAAAKKPARHKTRRVSALTTEVGLAPGPLDAPLYVTCAGEAALRIVDYCHAPVTAAIQEFVVNVQHVSARPSDPTLSADRAREITRQLFQDNDYRELPYLRVIGRVLDELLNHRRQKACSGGDVYMVLLEEIEEELPAAHRQGRRPYDRTLNPGRKTIDNRLRKLKGRPREAGIGSRLVWVETTSITQGGAEQGYKLTENGSWLFDGWPELPKLIQGRAERTL